MWRISPQGNHKGFLSWRRNSNGSGWAMAICDRGITWCSSQENLIAELVKLTGSRMPKIDQPPYKEVKIPLLMRKEMLQKKSVILQDHVIQVVRAWQNSSVFGRQSWCWGINPMLGWGAPCQQSSAGYKCKCRYRFSSYCIFVDSLENHQWQENCVQGTFH